MHFLKSIFGLLFKKEIKMVVHDGSFHPDEIFACAVMSIWANKNNKKIKIIRTRDQSTISSADIVADVGWIYDFQSGRFDHHQKGGAGTRENGIPYASFGLVWKKFGEDICDSKEVSINIEKCLVIPTDAIDNGINIVASVFR